MKDPYELHELIEHVDDKLIEGVEESAVEAIVLIAAAFELRADYVAECIDEASA